MTKNCNGTGKSSSHKKTVLPQKELFVNNVSIIILTYNQWHHTKRCLQSVLNNTNIAGLEVIVVDNASDDETITQLAKWDHPALKVITSPINLGYAGGNNLGCHHASGEYLVLLNNDTIVPPGWLERLLSPIACNTHIGLAGPVTNNSYGEQKLDLCIYDPSTGADAYWLREFYRLNHGNMRFTNYLSFFCVAMRKAVFEDIGELDNNFSVGMFEDTDYCERIKTAGYLLAVAEDAFVFHYGSASFSDIDHTVYQSILSQNRDYYERKWHKQWQPRPVVSPFLNSDPKQIAAALARTARRCVLLLYGYSWWGAENRCLQLAEGVLNEGAFVFVQTPSYYGKQIYGIRQAGPSFLLTNRIELLEHAAIDTVIYCGETVIHRNLQAKVVILDRLSYSQTEYQQIGTGLKNQNT